MKERPILFNGEMVRAILAGRKTQTRRVVRKQFSLDDAGACIDDAIRCPYGMRGARSWDEPVCHLADSKFVVGRRLWVRETWAVNPYTPEVRYRATDELWTDAGPLGWRPSIHMPRAECRILLEVVSVRVEKLNDISRGDAMAEGCPFPNMAAGDDPRQWYSALWDQINGADSWEANPWVWVVEFKRVEGL